MLAIIPWQKPLLQFQMLELARKVTVTFGIALSHLGPMLQATPEHQNLVHGHRLTHLEHLAAKSEFESTRLLEMKLAPYIEKPEEVKELKTDIKNWLVNNTIRADPSVRQAIVKIMHRESASQDSSEKLPKKDGDTGSNDTENEPDEPAMYKMI
jgi:hypothetical protein